MPPKVNRQQDAWDGNERRGLDDRRNELGQPTYFEQMILQHLQQQSTQIEHPKPQASSALTMIQQVMGITGIVFAGLFAGFGAWNNLNKEIDIQKNTFVMFKESIERDVSGIERNIADLKKASDDLKAEDKSAVDRIERRLQELDSTVSQLYQKITNSQTRK